MGKIILVAILIIYMLIITAGLSYDNGHTIAWKKAMNIERLYYQTTGEFPSQAWIDKYRAAHFEDEDDIWKSLEYFRSK